MINFADICHADGTRGADCPGKAAPKPDNPISLGLAELGDLIAEDKAEREKAAAARESARKLEQESRDRYDAAERHERAARRARNRVADLLFPGVYPTT